MTRLFLVRHAASEGDGVPRYWGQSDLPLSPLGIRQAERLRERLAGERFAGAYASDLRRALATAEIVLQPRGLTVAACPELREIDFGACEGLTYAEICERYPDAERFWAADGLVGFPNGESTAQVAERVKRFLARLASHEEEAALLVVAHGGPLSLLICLLLGLPHGRWWQFRLDVASLSIIDVYPSGAVLSLLNDRCHLPP